VGSLDKAQAFLDHAKRCAIRVRKPAVEAKPHLWEAIAEAGASELTSDQKEFKWDFLHVVAMTWWAVSQARSSLAASDFEQVTELLEQQLSRWNAGAVAGLADLNEFIKAYGAQYQSMTEVDEVVRFTKMVVGGWLLWNLTDKATLADEAEIAYMLGHGVYRSVDGYWETLAH
jgi:hypothetical protein